MSGTKRRTTKAKTKRRKKVDPVVKQQKVYSSRFLLIFAAGSLALCFIYIFMITFMRIPEGNERYADVCLGFLLGTFMATIIQFYYGSSKGKDAAIESMQQQYQDTMSKLQMISSIAGSGNSYSSTETGDCAMERPSEADTYASENYNNFRGPGAAENFDNID